METGPERALLNWLTGYAPGCCFDAQDVKTAALHVLPVLLVCLLVVMLMLASLGRRKAKRE